MGILGIALALVVLSAVFFVVYRLFKVRRQNAELNKQRFERIKPLYEKFKSGQPISSEDVFPFAQNLQTRELCFELLSKNSRVDLFPQEYNTIIKAAESNLANWLEFPTELDAIPDEIEHLKRVTIDFDGQKNFVHYEVFRFRVNEPHWAAKDGWLLGVVGPYFDESKPYDFPGSTFSRFGNASNNITPEEEAQWVHENISKRQWK